MRTDRRRSMPLHRYLDHCAVSDREAAVRQYRQATRRSGGECVYNSIDFCTRAHRRTRDLDGGSMLGLYCIQ